MLGSFQFSPRQGVLDPQQGKQNGERDCRQAEHQQPGSRPEHRRQIRSDDARQRQADIAGEFIQADGQAALVGSGDVELGGLSHRPGQPLIDAEQQVARIGKVFSSPKRLELIELLCQGEKTVETLAGEASISLKLTSAHLRELRMAQLVETERRGKNILYRLADKSVADLWVQVHMVAEARLVELQLVLQKFATQPDDLVANDRESLMKAARKGEVVVLDVSLS